mgnify:CR=1 FL=1
MGTGEQRCALMITLLRGPGYCTECPVCVLGIVSAVCTICLRGAGGFRQPHSGTHEAGEALAYVVVGRARMTQYWGICVVCTHTNTLEEGG